MKGWTEFRAHRVWCLYTKILLSTDPWAPYWSHVIEGWDNRHHSNMLFLFYEDMNKVNTHTRLISDSLTHSPPTSLQLKKSLSNLKRHSNRINCYMFRPYLAIFRQLSLVQETYAQLVRTNVDAAKGKKNAEQREKLLFSDNHILVWTTICKSTEIHWLTI
jgi:hypothetical protein